MIERVYIKEYLSFNECELGFNEGLVVFTGPSGAGKSLLINAILALFGYKSVEAKRSEIDLQSGVDTERFGYESDEFITIKAIKKEKVRYFLNGSSISKKLLKEMFESEILYLHQRDNRFFESKNLLAMVDAFIQKKDFTDTKREYVKKYKEFSQVKKELEDLGQKEKNREELKEFLAFEIEKISRIDPKEGEYEELLEIKRKLSKKERLLEAIKEAQEIFNYEDSVVKALSLLDLSSDFFDGALNELREILYGEMQKLEELEDIEVEEVLNRIEELSGLKRRYGSIEAALEAKREKERELEELERSEFYKDGLIKRQKSLFNEIQKLAETLSGYRKEGIKEIEKEVNRLLPPLKLSTVKIEIKDKELDLTGKDLVEVALNGVAFEKISSGEYNRLRLAFMSAFGSKDGTGGILILDEIDANISGEESMAVAKILKELSKSYQIFAISHQAQLASVASQHFLVKKESGKSVVKELEGEQRVEEIARIISGQKITKEAREFAKKMLKEAE